MRGTAKIPISFSRPVDKGKVISMLAAVTAFLCALWRAWPYLRFIFSATIVWAFLTIVSLLLGSSRPCQDRADRSFACSSRSSFS